jgi:hypothetical protein
MLTTNQVPFIAQVSVIPYDWAMSKITNTKHVSIKH